MGNICACLSFLTFLILLDRLKGSAVALFLVVKSIWFASHIFKAHCRLLWLQVLLTGLSVTMTDQEGGAAGEMERKPKWK